MGRLRPRVIVAVVAILPAAIGAGTPLRAQIMLDPRPIPLAPGPAEPVCRMAERGRAILTSAQGAELYVEPSALLPSGDGVVVLGKPSYAWRSAAGRRILEASNPVLGTHTGQGRQDVPFPPGLGRFDVLKGEGLSDGRIAVLLEERVRRESDRVVSDVRSGEVTRIRSGFLTSPGGGEVDGWQWGEGPELPLGGVNGIELLRGTPLLAGPGDTLHWAAVRTEPSGIDVLLFTFDGLSWTSRVIASRFADAVGMTLMPGGEPLLAVTGLDPAWGGAPRSVRLYRGSQPDQMVLRVLEGGSDEQFQAPMLLPLPSGGWFVAWRRLRAAGGSDLEGAVVRAVDGEVRLLTTPGLLAAGAFYPAPAVGPGGPVVVSQHEGPLGTGPLLTVHRLTEYGAVPVYSTRNPFTGPMAASFATDGTLHIVGPLAEMATLTPSVRSLEIRLESMCTQEAAADHRPGTLFHSIRSHDAQDSSTLPPPGRAGAGGM